MLKFISQANKLLAWIGMAVIAILMLLTVCDVLGRWLFSSPIKGTYELTGIGLALMVFFSLGYAHRQREHIEMDFITAKFPKAVQRLLYGMIEIVVAVFMTVVAWQLFAYAQRLAKAKVSTSDLAIAMDPFVIVSAIGVIVFALNALAIGIEFFKGNDVQGEGEKTDVV